jgi:hypothetical protein
VTTRIEQHPHAVAVLAALQAAGLSVGDHHAPAGNPPYVVLYVIGGGVVDGTLGTPDSDGDLRFQVTAVGRHPGEARWIADRAAAALTDEPITVAGRVAQRVRPIEASSGVQRDDDVTPPLFYATARYGLWTFPA